MTRPLQTLRSHAAGIDTPAAAFVRDAARVETEARAVMSDMSDLIRHASTLYREYAQLLHEEDNDR